MTARKKDTLCVDFAQRKSRSIDHNDENGRR